METIIRSLPQTDWIRHRVVEGEKGPHEYEFVRLRVVEKIHRQPGSGGSLMARRPVGSGPEREIKFFLFNAPETVALAEMAWVGCLRWTIEEDFELAKGEVGLDHYEVTKYRGWYHHMTMCLLALSFLNAVQSEWGKKGAPASVPEVRLCLRSCCPGSAGTRPSHSPGWPINVVARQPPRPATPNAGSGSTLDAQASL